jgi:hypothetical protein
MRGTNLLQSARHGTVDVTTVSGKRLTQYLIYASTHIRLLSLFSEIDHTPAG